MSSYNHVLISTLDYLQKEDKNDIYLSKMFIGIFNSDKKIPIYYQKYQPTRLEERGVPSKENLIGYATNIHVKDIKNEDNLYLRNVKINQANTFVPWLLPDNIEKNIHSYIVCDITINDLIKMAIHFDGVIDNFSARRNGNDFILDHFIIYDKQFKQNRNKMIPVLMSN